MLPVGQGVLFTRMNAICATMNNFYQFSKHATNLKSVHICFVTHRLPAGFGPNQCNTIVNTPLVNNSIVQQRTFFFQ